MAGSHNLSWNWLWNAPHWGGAWTLECTSRLLARSAACRSNMSCQLQPPARTHVWACSHILRFGCRPAELWTFATRIRLQSLGLGLHWVFWNLGFLSGRHCRACLHINCNRKSKFNPLPRVAPDLHCAPLLVRRSLRYRTVWPRRGGGRLVSRPAHSSRRCTKRCVYR